MPNSKTHIKISGIKVLGGKTLIRASLMFYQQTSLRKDHTLITEFKDLANEYNGVFSQSNPLGIFTTSELKTEIRHRTGLPHDYKEGD